MIYIKIFLGKMLDVTLGTIVTIYIVKNKRKLATLIGFIDVFIWLMVVNEALKNSDNSLGIAIIYSFGYAFGTYIGSFITNHFNNDIINVQIITKNVNNKLSNAIKKSKYSASMTSCIGLHNNDKKYIIYITLNNRDLKYLLKIIKQNDNNAFVTINENREIIGGFIPK